MTFGLFDFRLLLFHLVSSGQMHIMQARVMHYVRGDALHWREHAKLEKTYSGRAHKPGRPACLPLPVLERVLQMVP